MDKKSPIVRVIRRSQGSSDVLVKSAGSITSADAFFSGDQPEPAFEEIESGKTVVWKSYCGVIGTGRVKSAAPHAGKAWMVECTDPPPEVWQKAGVPARARDVCIVFDWQLVRDI